MYSVRIKILGRIIIGALLGTFLTEVRATAQPSEYTTPAEPIAEMQTLIDQLATGTTSRHPISEQEFKNGIAQISKLASDDRRVILEQLLLYNGQKRLKDDGMASTLGVGVIMREFSYQNSEILSISYLMLLRSDPYWSDRIAKCFLNGISSSDNVDAPDFSLFEQLIREKKVSSADTELYPIYRYMFKRSPGQAVRTMQKIDGIASGLDSNLAVLEARFGAAFLRTKNSEQIDDSAVAEAIQDLSARETWWLRLFVTEVLKRQTDFASPAVLSELAADPNPLVAEFGREVARAIEREFTR